jgi:hypothetical protein
MTETPSGTVYAATVAEDGSVAAGGGFGVIPAAGSCPVGVVTALAWHGETLVAGGTGGIARWVVGVDAVDGMGGGWEAAHRQGGDSTIAALVAGGPARRTLFAATLGDGMLRSTDGGRRWRLAGFGLTTPKITELACAADGTVYAGGADGVHVSRAEGRAWSPCPGTEGAAVAALACLPGGRVVAALENGGTLRSEPDGSAWLPAGRIPRGASALAVLDDGALLLGTTASGLRWSRDGGGTFEPLPAGPSSTAVHCLATGHGALWAGTDDGLLTSPGPGLPWRPHGG